MQLNNVLETNIKTSKSSRWEKLYRKIHNLFISKELVHIKDFKREIDEIHKRIDQINDKLDSNLNSLSSMISAHFHTAPQAVAGFLPTTPPNTPAVVTLTPIPRKPFKDIEMQAEDRNWFAYGPARAPLSPGTTASDLAANTQAVSDIGT